MRKTFIELKRLWNSQCLATRLISLIGLVLFFHIIVISLTGLGMDNEAYTTIKNVMSSIFGYIFGGKVITNNNNIANKKFQIIFTGIIAFGSLIIVIVSHWIYIDNHENPAATEIRNTLFTAVGFLISKAENQEIESQIIENKKNKKPCDKKTKS